MSTLPKILQSTTKIRFQDCDPFNHLNNSSYINYFMNHREDALIENYNFDIYKRAKKEGKSWVSSSNQIIYLKPALLMETVIIESQLLSFNNSELHVEMRMYNNDKSQLKAFIWSGFIHFNLLTQKREYHDQELMDLFKAVINPVNSQSFEDRLIELKPTVVKNV
ncbi:acyl-CoA thioesterase [Snuella sedimenti]|uniref:Acyl-CoA thioesterase n=1 Tax=Snuella sedimenti TaxID=2798802 RepID=A0A8J7LYP4_9FLAO|nr:acyl-CoA thioesterase [Snuella sedimenti]MBJ6368756.1 acyl-CoA thioesterase [Snuella sedimenti]